MSDKILILFSLKCLGEQDNYPHSSFALDAKPLNESTGFFVLSTTTILDLLTLLSESGLSTEVAVVSIL